ncbi:hypothetical protein [Amycolatopsis kentuckyensis]|uniref:hypothetical protein n=1 Tax=Amycolatopsis kentuckyensis TaxID=218823 RepID=UPI003569F43A
MSPLSTVDELKAALADLVSARVIGFSRTVNIAEVGFARGEVETWLHAQCPFRVTRGESTWFGTVDTAYPATADADPAEAYRKNETMFDKRARQVSERFQSVEYVVETATLGRAGTITLELTGAVVIEVFPACGGPIEQWRLFDRGSDVHYVFPDAAVIGDH